MSLTPGSRIGAYEIVSALGAGGMGEVFRARDTRLKRDVAIKVLPVDVTSNPERLGRFEREAHLLASLNHPNIAAVYGLEESGSAPAIVMQLVEGESLAQRIARGPLSVEDAIAIARQLADGLEYAHEHGIVHRDLKPANVVVGRDGAVRILDFGLAKAIGGDSGDGSSPDATHSPTLTSPATRAGVILGTAAYMSPEQARGKSVDRRADIWAFGVVCHEMLTGKRLFDGETISDTIAAILTQTPDFTALPSGTPASLRRLLERCLDRDPRTRLRDIGEARIMLGAREVDAITTVPAPAAGAKRALLPWVVAGIAIAVAATAWITNARKTPDAPAIIKYTQLTFRPQMIFQALYAPDAQTMVFSAAGSGSTPYLYSLRPEYTEPLQMSDQPLHLLSISRTGELAVLTRPRWFAHRLCRGTLARMPLAGGAPREILENVVQATWAPDGSDLAIARDVDGVYRLEYPAGTALYQTGAYLSDLRFSPDGKHIAYFEHPVRYDDRGALAVVDLNGKRTVLSDGYWGLEGIAWSPDSKTVYFSSGTGFANFSVYASSLTGETRLAAQSAGGLFIHDIAKSGEWLATRDDQGRIMRGRAPGATAELDLEWQELSRPIDISNDGRTLLFAEYGGRAGNNYQVCVRGLDGSPVVVLGEGEPMDLSDDGRLALALVYPKKLMVYPTGAGTARELDTSSIARMSIAFWMDNDRRVFILGGAEGEGERCYTLDFPDGTPRELAVRDVVGAVPSPDGTRIIAMDPALRWWVIPLDAPDRRQELIAVTKADAFAQWNRAGTGVYFFHQDRLPTTLDLIDLASGARTPAITLDPGEAALAVRNAVIADQAGAYVYSAITYTSRLYSMEHAR